VALQKLSSTDAFVVTDLPGATQADGVVRWAKKVLQDGARTMARSRTYSWALLERRISGASAGISAPPDGRDAAIAAFVEEMQEPVASGALSLDAGKGVAPGDLTALQELDRRSPLRLELADELLGIGIAAAAEVALGGLSGAKAVVEGAGAAGDAVAAALQAAGAEVVATGDGAEVATTDSDVLVCGSKLGLVDHHLAAELPQRAIVPCGVAPVTAKGLAVSRRRDIVVVADFLSMLGPLLSFRPPEGATADSLRTEADSTVRTIATEVAGHEEGPYLGACYRAEAFLSTWQETLPFGRPLA
jgi:hypothetical protein